MITAWRLVKSRFADHAFDGEGARLYGGRWNSPGTAVMINPAHPDFRRIRRSAPEPFTFDLRLVKGS